MQGEQTVDKYPLTKIINLAWWMNLIVSNTKGNMINREGHEGKNLTFFAVKMPKTKLTYG